MIFAGTSAGMIELEVSPSAALVAVRLCRVAARLHCGFRLMLQEDSERESVRNQEQRDYQSRKEECGSQLASQ